MIKQPYRKTIRILAFLLASAVSLQSGNLLAQSKNPGGTGGNGGASGKNQSSQDSSGQQASPSGSGSSNRVEAAMLAYDASEVIANHIAFQTHGRTLIIYDSQAFGALQSYEAYAATVSTLEAALRLSDLQALDGGTLASTVVSTLAALRSSTDYAVQTVDFNQDALAAQVASRLSSYPNTHVIVPKMLLLSGTDLRPPAVGTVDDENCSEIDKTVPEQLACLLNVRSEIDSVPDYVDKVFQLFIATVLGNGGTSATKPDPNGANPNPPPNPSSPNPASPSPSPSPSLLSLVIQGRRLKLQLTSPALLLVLEATVAGGSSRTRHNFWVEVFYTTPTPSFNGGAVVTYFLIDPETSFVTKSEVLRYMFDYGKFKDLKSVKKGANFCPVGEACP